MAYESAVAKWAPVGRILSRIIPLALLGVAAWVLWRELHTLSPAKVLDQIREWGPAKIAAVLSLTMLSYLFLATNETLSLRWAGASVPLRDSFAVSFIAYAFANNLGLSLIVTGVVRARAYARHGVDLATVASITLYCTLSFWLGLCVFAGVSFVTAKEDLFDVLGFSPAVGHAFGAGLLLVPILYVLACTLWRRPIVIHGRAWTLPRPLWAVSQILFGLGDNIVMAVLLWLLLAGQGPGFAEFASAYVTSLAAGLMSSLPGGVGVFESAMLTLLPTLDRAVLAAAFIGYRLSYFLVPLVLATGLLAFRERAGVGRTLVTLRSRITARAG